MVLDCRAFDSSLVHEAEGGGTAWERCDDSGVAGRRSRRQRSRGTRQRASHVDVGQPAAGSAPDGEDAASEGGNGKHFEALWEASRSGAWAGRGFHFQHAVGAWLTAKVGAGLIGAVVVPEGFEDVSLEGLGHEETWHVQAKSRGEDLGLFPVHVAVDHILDSWDKHLARDEADSKLAVVFERGVKGEALPTGLDASAPTLAESCPDGSKLLNSLKDKCGHSGMSEADADLLLSSVVAVGVAWDQVTNETAACIGAVVDLPPLSLSVGTELLVGVVARASAENASRRHADRRRLDKTEIVGEILRFAEQIDLESLKAAIRDGVCELFTYGVEELDEGGRFYEGEATQPFHVTSGLVVRRPDVLEKILSSLDDRFAVVITGPSGVGKSAVLWTVPRELLGVVWFRVKRLAVEDVPAILRLARANGVSTSTPVGFLVDSAGTGHFRGWERLRADAAAVPGMLLIATARNEDLTVLGSLTECATIAVQLDQHSAETIHRGLVLRGATSEAHWQEAFERSDGLTLEFTHLLTRGRRLRDVIEDQVRQRVVKERHSELKVLALASTADRWSAAIATADVARVCGLSDAELQGALYRLRSEHLVVERDGWIGGLHQLRSTAICEAVHATPPPTLGETIRRLIPIVPVSQLHRFVTAMLIGTPEGRSIIGDTARELAPDLERLAACIQGLRLADFRELAKIWDEIAEEHDVPAAARLALFAFAIGGTRPPDVFDSEFLEAWEAIAAVPEQDSRGGLIAEVGSHAIAQLVVSVTDPRQATHLLAVLAGCEPELAAVISDAANAESQLASALREAPVDVLADCLAAARGVDPAVAHALMGGIGGEQSINARIRADHPWITELEIRSGGSSSPVGYARFLHVSEAVQGSPDEHALGLARTMLRCLPRIESVDVQAVLPGGRELAMGGYTAGRSQLMREFDRAAPAVEWSRERTRSVAALIGTTDTARLSQVLPLLDEAAKLVREWGTALVVTGRPPGGDSPQRRAALHESGRSILPRLCDTRSGDAVALGQTTSDLADDLSATITSIAGNVIPRLRQPGQYRALAAYIAETVIDKHIVGATSEPWRLIGIDDHPTVLDALRSVLEDLYAIVDELANDDADITRIRISALSGQSQTTMNRAATTCRRANQRRHEKRRARIQATCDAAEPRARVFDSAHRTALSEYRVCVELDSLFSWHEAVDSLQSVLRADQRAGETYLLVPLRHGKPIAALAMTLINNLWPAPNPDGLDSLPPAQRWELADIFDKAHLALEALSGISELPDAQQAHDEVQALQENLASGLQTAHESLNGLPDDPVTAEVLTIIEGLVVRVQSELDHTSTEPSFAAQMAAIFTEEVTTEFTLIHYGRCLAYDWDINPSTAIEQLAAFDD